MTSLRHNDYIAKIEADEDGGFFHGEVINTRAVLTFQGRSLHELKHEFSETIAVYEEWRRERGKEPERPYADTLTLRMPPDLHRRRGGGRGAARQEPERVYQGNLGARHLTPLRTRLAAGRSGKAEAEPRCLLRKRGTAQIRWRSCFKNERSWLAPPERAPKGCACLRCQKQPRPPKHRAASGHGEYRCRKL